MAGAISYLRVLDAYELIFLDLRFKSRPLQKINPNVAIVEIGNDTLINLGRWPLSRDFHASLIKVLSFAEAEAVIFDLLFSEPQPQDQFLATASAEAGNVYFPYALSLQGNKRGFWQADKFNAPLLSQLSQGAKGTGHANVLADLDGKRRRLPLFIDYQGQLLPQLSLSAAGDYLGVSPDQIKIVSQRFIQLGRKMRIPIDQECATLVNLAGRWKDTFAHYSYFDILMAYANYEQGAAKPALLKELKGKVCFVGLTATGTADINPSALERVYPMVGLHANLFNSIVNQSFLRRCSRPANILILFLFCLASIWLTTNFKPLKGLAYQLGLLGAFTLSGFLLFHLAGLWIDMFFPTVACVCVYLGTNLARYIKELYRSELLEKELSIARNIQRSFLQEVPEGLPGVDIAVEMDTAKHVGGDLYDFVKFSDGRIGLMVGDVSGKGVPAALFMAQAISKFRYYANVCATPAETLTKLNQDISTSSTSGLFVTMAYLIYDPAALSLSLASAGHMPPLVFRDSQLLDKIEVSEGIPIGLMADADFTEQKFSLQKQDFVVLYSDGITEARNKKAEEYGDDAPIQALVGKQALPSPKIVQALKSALNAFVGRAPQHDDITIMVFKVI
ncbi:SpoIIE family protein phosphatase [Candidatus Omnitrophota bacterium]